ncbi:Regulator of RpoS [Fundidesulfovibrio magnetotacticus]|uniref:Regulator of RpoS n=1 Tax=Fundidesulfovibrio magnetotacticus TaxID=2730080 RepID=A0A6V8LUA3_9BACT|nr:response regulator [Fundidesulfovibrio magnetotacticus]GFK93386.1 Regulator of RpoS [Fundidesulfovibrio magnetotacticus]
MALVALADDSMFQRFFLRKIVSERGHETVEAANGRQLLELVEARTPDLVIMDLNMPEFSGLELLETFHARGVAFPVVVITADIQHTTRARCLELGAAEVLNKPVDEAAVNGVLSRMLPG